MLHFADPSPDDDPQLVLAFEENEFDIAGLADHDNADTTVTLALRELYLILVNGTEPRRSNRSRLARILLAMLTVARNDYAGSGHQEYWPFLFHRIEKVARATVGKGNLAFLRSQPHQSLLGRWFRLALDEFGYTIPEEGQTYVGPIVFHAGIPRTSLAGTVQLIDTAVQQFGQYAVNLPPDLRGQLVTNHIPPLHRNVERVLTSRLLGASQLWSSLARVVFAWRQYGDCSEELRQLPAALDADDVRLALPGKSVVSATRRTRTPLPQLRFDASTGEVRLTLPTGARSDWTVTACGRTVDLRWNHTHLALTAEFLAPPPEEFRIVHGSGAERIQRIMSTRPSHWPGVWFHASNGNLEDGTTIDANGLEPGRWYVLFEGTPTNCNIPAVYRVPLKWNCFAGHQHWTAWEIDVPSRTQDRTSLEWHIDDTRFCIPLTRRPGARVEVCNTPIASATTVAGEAVDVYANAPQVRLCRERSLAIALLRETDDGLETLQRVDLPPEQPWQVPVREPGVYQVREARGVGRTLLHFALMPRAEICGPIYDSLKQRVAIELSGAESIGQVLPADEVAISTLESLIRVEQSTVKPMLQCEWTWHNHMSAPRLTFQWPVEGLRWRVVRLSEEAARWTRAPVFISPKDVEKHDAQLEIQVPKDAELQVNDIPYSDKLQRGANGSGLTLSLLPFGEVVQVCVDGSEPRPAVVKSDRPIIDSLVAISDGDSVLATWSARDSQSEIVLVAWDPLQPMKDPLRIPLTAEQLSEQECEVPCTQLPGEWCSLALGRVVRLGFTRQILHFGVSGSELSRSMSILLNVTTGAMTSPHSDSPNTWIEFLHGLALDRLTGNVRNVEDIVNVLAEVEHNRDSNLDQCFHLDSVLADTVPAVDEQWRINTREALRQHIDRVVGRTPSRAFQSSHSTNPNAILQRLLRMGVPIGQSCPHKWLVDDIATEDAVCAYPFSFIRDLWLLGTREADALQCTKVTSHSAFTEFTKHQTAAAKRVWQFLQSHELLSAVHLLPMLHTTAWVRNTDCGHTHAVALQPRPVRTDQDFLDALGLDTVALDCQATCDDQFWEIRSTSISGKRSSEGKRNLNRQARLLTSRRSYSLLWEDQEQQWYIERPSVSPPTCCRAPTMYVPAIRSEKLTDDLELRYMLARWAKIDGASRGTEFPEGLVENFNELLCTDPVTGGLHRELLAPPQTETKELLGTVVVVPKMAVIDERALIAWQLAWVERLTAWHGNGHFFCDGSVAPGQHHSFLRALSEVCEVWPRLMRRCLALAELLIWTCYRGGLGVAMRFSNESPRSCNPLAATPQSIVSSQEPPLETFVHRTPMPTVVHRTPMPTVVTGAIGVIIDYAAGSGRIVVKHPTSPSLAATVKAYLDRKQASPSWIVRFDWKAIIGSDRCRLEDIHAAARSSGDLHAAGTLADILRGMTVHCELQKTHTWEVTSMRIAFSGQRFSILPNPGWASQ